MRRAPPDEAAQETGPRRRFGRPSEECTRISGELRDHPRDFFVVPAEGYLILIFRNGHADEGRAARDRVSQLAKFARPLKPDYHASAVEVCQPGRKAGGNVVKVGSVAKGP